MKVCFKSLAAGCIISTLGIATVFAAGGIKSATFNTNRVILDGKELNLNGQQMASIVLDGETNMSNYMPVRGVLEALGYTVSWDGAKSAVVLASPTATATATAPAATAEAAKPALVSVNKDGDTTIFTKVPTAHDLQGFWTATEDKNASVEYSFAECGNLRGYVVKDGTATDMYGKYTLTGNQIDFAYTTLGGKDLKNPFDLGAQTIGISDDGKKISLTVKDDDDGTTYVLVLTKNDEPVELKNTKTPSDADLNGTWSAKDKDIETTFTFDKGAATMSLNDGTTDPTIFTGKSVMEVVNGHDHKRIHFSFETSAKGADKTSFDKPMEMDFYIGLDGNKLIFTNGIDVISLTKK